MPSAITAGTKGATTASDYPADGVPVSKSVNRNNWAAAKAELDHGGFEADPTAGNAEATGSAVAANIFTQLQAARLPAVGELSGTALTVDAAYFGNASAVLIRCLSASAVTVTLAANVPAGKTVHIVQWGAGIVTAQAGASAFTRKTAAAALATAEQYDSLVLTVAQNNGGNAAEWLLI